MCSVHVGGLCGKHLTHGWPRPLSSQDGTGATGSSFPAAVGHTLSKIRSHSRSGVARSRDGRTAIGRTVTVAVAMRVAVQVVVGWGRWRLGMGAEGSGCYKAGCESAAGSVAVSQGPQVAIRPRRSYASHACIPCSERTLGLEAGRGCHDAVHIQIIAFSVAHGPNTPHMSLGERVAV